MSRFNNTRNLFSLDRTDLIQVHNCHLANTKHHKTN